jgi:hypothetical protein
MSGREEKGVKGGKDCANGKENLEKDENKLGM